MSLLNTLLLLSLRVRTTLQCTSKMRLRGFWRFRGRPGGGGGGGGGVDGVRVPGRALGFRVQGQELAERRGWAKQLATPKEAMERGHPSVTNTP